VRGLKDIENVKVGEDDSRYRLLVDAITDYAIFMIDPRGRIGSWNVGAQRLTGYGADEVEGLHASRLSTEDDRAGGALEEALRQAALNDRFDGERWLVRKDGTRFLAYMALDSIRDRDGQLVGYAAIARDLTERRRAEEAALKRSEEQFRLLVEGVTDYAIYMLDPDGRVSSWNAGAQRFKGYQAHEILGENFSRFYTEEDRAAHMPQQALRIAATEGRFEREGWRVRKDGARFWAHVVIDPIREDGRLIGFTKITRDVTERREAQRALENAQQALFQSQKLESIGQLTGGVAHDFNNLLTAIMGSLELLKKRLPADAKAHALLENALQGALRGASLTQRMLAFARRQALQSEAVDIPALVEGMRGLMERSIGPRVVIRTQFADDLPAALSDANQLDSALLNLVINARDAMPDGGMITIAADAHALDADNALGLPAGNYVRLSVQDSGEGMDESTLQRATEPFFTTKGVGKGTGLGLSMVHGLAEQSGGKLTLQSIPAEGTTVELWLPTGEGASLAAALPSRPQEAAGDTQCLTILVVEDDPLVLVNTAAMLEDLGHKVIETESADQALDILSRDVPIDLMITDQAMPGMTGLELAARVKQQRPDLPIILASGYAELTGPPRPNLASLAKPFNEAQLAEAVSAALSTLRDPAPGKPSPRDNQNSPQPVLTPATTASS
jgi:PAS domain S-box-containing protein